MLVPRTASPQTVSGKEEPITVQKWNTHLIFSDYVVFGWCGFPANELAMSMFCSQS